ncbi:hypothetical protein KAR91_64800 [Candidatus Pacearchaeota archaeon]|nr:hypothetical protein [Candidatus Pacearchaeota archaeon]
MAGWTNRGKFSVLDWAFRGATIPTNFYVGLVTSATAPTADINTFGELTEITAGNGYTTGGFSLTPNGTDFDSLTEDDTTDKALLQIKDVAWTASGGNIPSAGNGARYAVLLDDNGTVGSRLVLAFWDLTSDRTVSDTQTLTLIDLELDLTE